MCGSGTTLVAAKLLQRHWIGIDIAPEAIELANARLDNPQKTFSRLLEVGKEAYFNQDDKTRNILDTMNALTVQRNNGLYGLLKTHYHGTSVAIRVQRQNETLEEAKKQLLRASVTKGCILKILVRTTPYHTTTMFDIEDTDTNLLIVDSHDLTISQWLQEKQEQATTLLA